jgi:hypothetical protein
VAMRGEVRDYRPLFIGAGKAVTRPDFELEELRAMAVENIPVWTSAGEAPCGAALCI